MLGRRAHLYALPIRGAKGDGVRVAHADTCHEPLLASYFERCLHSCSILETDLVNELFCKHPDTNLQFYGPLQELTWVAGRVVGTSSAFRIGGPIFTLTWPSSSSRGCIKPACVRLARSL